MFTNNYKFKNRSHDDISLRNNIFEKLQSHVFLRFKNLTIINDSRILEMRHHRQNILVDKRKPTIDNKYKTMLFENYKKEIEIFEEYDKVLNILNTEIMLHLVNLEQYPNQMLYYKKLAKFYVTRLNNEACLTGEYLLSRKWSFLYIKVLITQIHVERLYSLHKKDIADNTPLDTTGITNLFFNSYTYCLNDIYVAAKLKVKNIHQLEHYLVTSEKKYYNFLETKYSIHSGFKQLLRKLLQNYEMVESNILDAIGENEAIHTLSKDTVEEIVKLYKLEMIHIQSNFDKLEKSKEWSNTEADTNFRNDINNVLESDLNGIKQSLSINHALLYDELEMCTKSLNKLKEISRLKKQNMSVVLSNLSNKLLTLITKFLPNKMYWDFEALSTKNENERHAWYIDLLHLCATRFFERAKSTCYSIEETHSIHWSLQAIDLSQDLVNDAEHWFGIKRRFKVFFLIFLHKYHRWNVYGWQPLLHELKYTISLPTNKPSLLTIFVRMKVLFASYNAKITLKDPFGPCQINSDMQRRHNNYDILAAYYTFRSFFMTFTLINKVLEIRTTYMSFAILSIGCDATMSNQCKQRTALLQDAIHLQSINMHISRHNIDIDVVPGTLVSNLTISRLLYMKSLIRSLFCRLVTVVTVVPIFYKINRFIVSMHFFKTAVEILMVPLYMSYKYDNLYLLSRKWSSSRNPNLYELKSKNPLSTLCRLTIKRTRNINRFTKIQGSRSTGVL